MILLDLQKAFDSVWHHGLLYKLHLIKIPDCIIRIVRSYLMDRFFIVNFCDAKSTPYSVDSGVPQGSVLDPCARCYSIYLSTAYQNLANPVLRSMLIIPRYLSPLGASPYSRVDCKPILMTSCNSSRIGGCQSILIKLRR